MRTKADLPGSGPESWFIHTHGPTKVYGQNGPQLYQSPFALIGPFPEFWGPCLRLRGPQKTREGCLTISITSESPGKRQARGTPKMWCRVKARVRPGARSPSLLLFTERRDNPPQTRDRQVTEWAGLFASSVISPAVVVGVTPRTHAGPSSSADSLPSRIRVAGCSCIRARFGEPRAVTAPRKLIPGAEADRRRDPASVAPGPTLKTTKRPRRKQASLPGGSGTHMGIGPPADLKVSGVCALVCRLVGSITNTSRPGTGANHSSVDVSCRPLSCRVFVQEKRAMASCPSASVSIRRRPVPLAFGAAGGNASQLRQAGPPDPNPFDRQRGTAATEAPPHALPGHAATGQYRAMAGWDRAVHPHVELRATAGPAEIP